MAQVYPHFNPIVIREVFIVFNRPGQRRIFYTDFNTNQILVANIDGTGSQVIMEDDLEVPGT